MMLLVPLLLSPLSAAGPLAPSPQDEELLSVYIADALTPRLTLPLSLSYDHRVIDGADAARFTTKLVEVLADVRSLTS